MSVTQIDIDDDALDRAMALSRAKTKKEAVNLALQFYADKQERAARIAVGSVAAEVAHAPRGLTRVVFCCFSPDAAEHHTRAFTDLGLA